MANNFFAAINLIGGLAGALDAIDGSLLIDGDSAIVQTDGIVYFYHLDATSGAAESSPDIIKPDSNAGTKRWIKQAISGGGGGASPDYIRLHDEKATTVNGGDFTADTWTKRDITEDQDEGAHCSVASSVITLAAGTYECFIMCPANGVDSHVAKLVNTSDTEDTIIGSAAYTNDLDVMNTNSVIRSRFTIAASKTFEIQHRCGITQLDYGLGASGSTGTVEVYTVAEFWKIS